MKLLGVVEVVEDFCAKNLLRRGDILFRLQKSINHLLEYLKTVLLGYSSFFLILYCHFFINFLCFQYSWNCCISFCSIYQKCAFQPLSFLSFCCWWWWIVFVKWLSGERRLTLFSRLLYVIRCSRLRLWVGCFICFKFTPMFSLVQLKEQID